MNASITLESRNYKNQYSNWNGDYSYLINELHVIRAIITIGFQDKSDVYKMSTINKIYKVSLGMMALSFLEFGSKKLRLARSHMNLDPSEKTFLSYWYGMIFTKLVAEYHMDIPWLQHVDDLRIKGILSLKTKSKKRGDLVGYDKSRNWHALEAKCRSNYIPDLEDLRVSAKEQVKNIKSINKDKPKTYSTVISRVLRSGVLIYLDDPDYSDGEGEHFSIEKERFFQSYYEGIITYLSIAKDADYVESSGILFRTAPLRINVANNILFDDCLENYQIGLCDQIYKNPKGAYSLERSPLSEFSSESKNIGSDGIAIFKIKNPPTH